MDSVEKENNFKKGRTVFGRYVKPEAVDYCTNLWLDYGFLMKVTKSRKTVRGNFMFDPKTKSYTITVNGDLNPYSFLFTYLHELAHLLTHKSFSGRVLPHGKEWKAAFAQLLVQAHSKSLFPKEMDEVLSQFLKDPKATVHANHELELFLSNYDPKTEKSANTIHLKEIPVGKKFYFQERAFIKLETKRTRILCQELQTGKKYLISAIAVVSLF